MVQQFGVPNVTITLDDRGLRALESRAPELVDEALQRVALLTATRAQSNIRAVGAIDTGFMINTTRARPIRPRLWSVGTAAEYGKYIEYGTRYVSPRPWLGPAMAGVKRSLAQVAGQMLRRVR